MLCDSDSSSKTEELKQLKYWKVLQKFAPTRNTSEKKVNILENGQIFPPLNSKNESDSDLEKKIKFVRPVKNNKKLCLVYIFGLQFQIPLGEEVYILFWWIGVRVCTTVILNK